MWLRVMSLCAKKADDDSDEADADGDDGWRTAADQGKQARNGGST